MSNTNTNKSFLPTTTKDVRYLNRDFSQLKAALISFTKTYFPNTYKDFTAASPGMMFIEQAAYVGDVLSFYTDYIFKESLLSTAQERQNIINLASYLGYKSKTSRTSIGTIDIYQLCPAVSDGNGSYSPDPMYMLKIMENSQFSSNNNSYFILTQEVDFSINTSNSPVIASVYSTNTDNTPQFFLLQKSGNIMGGEIISTTITVNDPIPNYSYQLSENNVLKIISMVDSNNNTWYEVDYMAQELIPIQTDNTSNDFEAYKDVVPYILNYISTSRKFVTSIDANNITTITFGAGINAVADELVNLDSNLIGNGLRNITSVNIPIDPSTFLQNDNYGIAPTNTTLTVKYLVGGGLNSNAQTGEITNISNIIYNNNASGLTPPQATLLTTVKNSLRVNNSQPCVGGNEAESNVEISMNAAANFGAQNRCVTLSDYLARIYSLPSQYGSIAKAHVISNLNLNGNVNATIGTVNTDNSLTVTQSFDRQFLSTNNNPFAINLYVLAFDANKNLTKTNPATIYNLINYLKQYKLLTDEINIIDGYIINIGVDIQISIYKGYNRQEVVSNCIAAVQSFFNIDNWSFSQPINISQLQLSIGNVEGVQSVSNINIYNKTILDGLYSPIEYNIDAATSNGIIYPSVDPSIWEVKYPDTDITVNISS